LPGGKFLDPLLPGLHLIPPGRREHGGSQLGAHRRQPGLFQASQLVGGSLDRLGQGAETVGTEALQREAVFHHTLGGGQAVSYLAQVRGDRGQLRWRR
jgi:hypothetical protein